MRVICDWGATHLEAAVDKGFVQIEDQAFPPSMLWSDGWKQRLRSAVLWTFMSENCDMRGRCDAYGTDGNA